jgi:hypothetical protein
VIAVVHLVWGPLGAAWPRQFLDSYRHHRAGVEHELVLLLNNVDDDLRMELTAELEGIEHRLLDLGQPVQDLAAYAQAAQRLTHERLCFLNSYSEIVAEDWLAKLVGAHDQSGVGLAGATGSWASLGSWARTLLHLPSPYSARTPDRKLAGEQFEQIGRELSGAEEPQPHARSHARAQAGASSIRSRLGTMRSLAAMAEQIARFPGFPAPHLRTNAFIVERATFMRLRSGRLRRKVDAYALESGRGSMTRQIEALGLRTLVVDRDGACHGVEDWPRSHTFWQAGQERLMVADNQTRIYTNGGPQRRALLSALAWGAQADTGSLAEI